MRTFNSFWSLDFCSFYLVSQACMVLLRMKSDTLHVHDYRPISLIHSFSKMVAKTLSLRLAPFMHELVRPNQSDIIKGCAIHDNFRMVQATSKLLHVHKHPCILLKIDIVKAFDTVSWPFLLDLLKYMGYFCR
jgi:ABC-type long-subunit fatty acid transport system fused permease/ATPase subunit